MFFPPQNAGFNRGIFRGAYIFFLKSLSISLKWICNSIYLFSHLLYLSVSICSCPTASRRSTRWWTAATAPLRGLWTWAPVRSPWRGYASTWTGKMKPMAGWSQTGFYLQHNVSWHTNMNRAHCLCFYLQQTWRRVYSHTEAYRFEWVQTALYIIWNVLHVSLLSITSLVL